MKENNAKNPLIIWIHGQGEGITDVEIALLGNKVRALAGSKIQSYFTTENGAKGAYVLVVQTRTYWMDGGNDENMYGDGETRYTEILMDTIKDYVKKNPDVDTNRVYIGGCSNGSYMATKMIITYPEYWAACYLPAHGYPYMMYKRDENGYYIVNEKLNFPLNAIQTDVKWFDDKKVNAIKNIPQWIIQSEDDPVVNKIYLTFPIYNDLIKAGNKNCWYSYFKTVEGTDIPGLKFNGHWSWILLFDDLITKVQDRDSILLQMMKKLMVLFLTIRVVPNMLLMKMEPIKAFGLG